MKDYQNKSWEELVAAAERATTTLDIIAAFVDARKRYHINDSEFYQAVGIVFDAVRTVDGDG